jgi:hypothetical protein
MFELQKNQCYTTPENIAPLQRKAANKHSGYNFERFGGFP